MGMKLITVLIPPAYLMKIDDLVREGAYNTRSETIRIAIRDMLIEHDKFFIQPFQKIKKDGGGELGA